jgi:DNA polymerase III delta prime subunit
MLEHVIWTEKYRPKRIEDCILPKDMKKIFSDIVSNGRLPNLLLVGPTGTGKTTVAKAMCEEMDVDYIIINGSMNGNIDTLRSEILQFASTVSMFGNKRKVVILDEADYLNANSTQPALRNFMEEYAINCGFILTCNFPNRIIDPLKGRCATVDFVIPNAERSDLLKQALRSIRTMLETEAIPHDMKAVATLTNELFPNLRKVINELQKYASTGRIDAGILAKRSDIGEIIKILKTKKFVDMRTWVAQNSDMDFNVFVSELYNQFSDQIDPPKVPFLTLILNKYDYQNAFVANREINIAAMLLEIMSDCC